MFWGQRVAPPFPERLHLNALTVRLRLEQELSILRWADWAQQQVVTWPATDDPGTWGTQGALAAVVADSRAATDGPVQPPR